MLCQCTETHILDSPVYLMSAHYSFLAFQRVNQSNVHKSLSVLQEVKRSRAFIWAFTAPVALWVTLSFTVLTQISNIGRCMGRLPSTAQVSSRFAHFYTNVDPPQRQLAESVKYSAWVEGIRVQGSVNPLSHGWVASESNYMYDVQVIYEYMYVHSVYTVHYLHVSCVHRVYTVHYLHVQRVHSVYTVHYLHVPRVYNTPNYPQTTVII